MKERPILFSAPMVRTVLDGTKTQTRRAIKKWSADCVGWFDDGDGEWAQRYIDERGNPHLKAWRDRCPYGQPGDLLWVRETWAAPHSEDGRPPRAIQCDQMRIHYAATEDRGGLLWRPSIHMPRWASRITLEVTGVRVERLQDISEVDATHEGIRCTNKHRWGLDATGIEHNAPTHAFRALWGQINGPFSWEANPWVWVVEFKRVEGNKA